MVGQPPAQHKVEQHGRAQRRGHGRRAHGDSPLNGSQCGEGGLAVTPKIFLGAKVQICLLRFFPTLHLQLVALVCLVLRRVY